MNKCIFIIDLWQKHYCNYINNWSSKNIDNFNNFLQKCREKKYTIIFLSTTGEYNYVNTKHKLMNKPEVKMQVPCSTVLCACDKDFSCYFNQLHCKKEELHQELLNKLHYDKNFKKPELKKLMSKLLQQGKTIKKDIMNEKIHNKIFIQKTDYIIPNDRNVLLSLLEKNNIQEIYYCGQVVNMCISHTRHISINKILNYNFKCNIIEDLSLSFGYNGFNLEEKILDEKITPKVCHQQIKNYLEKFNIKFIQSKELLS